MSTRIFSLILVVVSLVNGHGKLKIPAPRDEIGTGYNSGNWHYCSFFVNQYYLRNGQCDVCGANGFRDITGVSPTKGIYNSGDKILLTAQIGNHGGYMRVRLCKLNSPTEKVTHDCVNQNILRIEPKKTFENFGNGNLSYAISGTSYVLNTPAMGFDTQYNSEFYVYLPVGLSCENCVLQWEWHTTDQVDYCRYKSGASASNSYNADYKDSPCATQIFRSCADIKIKPIPNQPAQQNVPFTVPDKEPVFGCRKHRTDRGNPTGSGFGSLAYAGYPDSNKGRHMICVMPDSHPRFNDTDTTFLRNTYCPNCYTNCFINNNCPSDCYCQYFNRYAGSTNVVIIG